MASVTTEHQSEANYLCCTAKCGRSVRYASDSGRRGVTQVLVTLSAVIMASRSFGLFGSWPAHTLCFRMMMISSSTLTMMILIRKDDDVLCPTYRAARNPNPSPRNRTYAASKAPCGDLMNPSIATAAYIAGRQTKGNIFAINLPFEIVFLTL